MAEPDRGARFISLMAIMPCKIASAPKMPDIVWKYPANLPALQNAIGVIIHNDYSRRLAQHFYAK